MRRILTVLTVVALVATVASSVIAAVEPFQSGGARLVEKQYTDGSWGWPLNAPPTYGNIVGPIGMGLAQAYRFTGDADQLSALGNVATYLQAKTVFSPSDGYLAAQLDAVLGGTTNADYVRDNYYGKLAAGTYVREGVSYDTASLVAKIRADRAAQGIGNLAAWDLGMGIVGASAVGVDTSEWVNGTEAEVNELDSSGDYDVIGLAGAIYGLAMAGADIDPTSGPHAAASNVGDLADVLDGYQIAEGGFTWNAGYMKPNEGNETVQETAYAILALNAVDRAEYLDDIQGAADYLRSVQLATGGWENYPGNGENNEVTGEALWGVAAAVPEPSTFVVWSVLGLVAGGYGVWRRKK